MKHSKGKKDSDRVQVFKDSFIFSGRLPLLVLLEGHISDKLSESSELKKTASSWPSRSLDQSVSRRMSQVGATSLPAHFKLTTVDCWWSSVMHSILKSEYSVLILVIDSCLFGFPFDQTLDLQRNKENGFLSSQNTPTVVRWWSRAEFQSHCER